MSRRRSGFTLTELLIVISILLILSTMALMAVKGNSTDKARSGVRVAQSAFLGAKDRAMHAKNFRGVRLTRDANGPTFSATNTYPCLVNGFAYTQPIAHDPYPTGSISLERVSTITPNIADGPDILIVRGISTGNVGAVDWSSVYGFFGSVGQIRIPSTTGQWYTFTVATTGPYAIGPGNQCLILQTPYSNTAAANPSPIVVAYPFTGSTPAPIAGCDIQFGNEVLPFHQPISLPSGIVIDLRWCSQNVQYLAGGNITTTTGPAPNIDISFSPRGQVAGATGGLGALYFTVRDLADATKGLSPSDPTVTGDCLILALNPQTGLVQTYDANLVDVNPADGLPDDLFAFCKAGKAAGR